MKSHPLKTRAWKSHKGHIEPFNTKVADINRHYGNIVNYSYKIICDFSCFNSLIINSVSADIKAHVSPGAVLGSTFIINPRFDFSRAASSLPLLKFPRGPTWCTLATQSGKICHSDGKPKSSSHLRNNETGNFTQNKTVFLRAVNSSSGPNPLQATNFTGVLFQWNPCGSSWKMKKQLPITQQTGCTDF